MEALMKFAHVISLFLTLSLSIPAFAGRADRRQFSQHARIHQGVRNGDLNRGEAARLRAGQRHVRRLERRAEKDGVVTPKEHLRIEKAQNRQSSRIYKEKHDEQKQGQ